MNKTELIDHIASKADISKAAAGRSLDALIGAVKTTLKKGGTVTLVGFGTFAVSARAARTGRNPRTGETIKIKKAKVPKFRPGKAPEGRRQLRTAWRSPGIGPKRFADNYAVRYTPARVLLLSTPSWQFAWHESSH